MQFVLCFGNNYYYDTTSVPAFVQHKVSFFVGKWGADLDTGGPTAAAHRANFLLRKWGLTNI